MLQWFGDVIHCTEIQTFHLPHRLGNAVMKITAMSFVDSLTFKRRQVSKPSIPGMITSNKIRSGEAYSTFWIALSLLSYQSLKPESAKKSKLPGVIIYY